MEFAQTNEQIVITDQNKPTSTNKMKPKKLVLSFANQQELESTSTSHQNDALPINVQSAENEVATRIATEIVDQCFSVIPEMQAIPNSSTSQLESSAPAVVEHQLEEKVMATKENTLKSESQPQPQRRMTLPAAIHIMNEFGQKTDVIDIDPNNNFPQVAMSKIGRKRSNQNRPYRLTKEEKAAAVLIKNVSFGYTKNHNIISNISLHVPVGK